MSPGRKRPDALWQYRSSHRRRNAESPDVLWVSSYHVSIMWSIRTSQHSDIQPVLALWAAAAAEPTHTDTAEHLGNLITHDPSALIVAEEDGLLVGTVVAGWDGWRGSIYRLVVAPSHRRLGLGSRLLQAAESRLAAVGAVRLQAIVVETESPATAFWGASDWEQQAHRLRFVRG